jgi:hypothetical protein
MLQHGLLVLGIIVFGVLGDIAKIPGCADPFGYLLPLDRGEIGDLVLKLLEAFFCKYDFFARHDYLPWTAAGWPSAPESGRAL